MTRVYVDIVGDLFHIGHLNLFKKAISAFDNKNVSLVVGVHSDKDVSSYKRKPIIPQEQRYEIVRSCKYVDEVIEASPLVITEDFINKHKIDYVVHGDDVTKEISKQHAVVSKMGIIKYVPYTDGVSTTSIIQKIKVECIK
ncbi:MAG: glycerol-3-phosphate cytidylyltransferase [Pusillimonas sp.]|jgi:cytidyltransferase-like protein|nr:glycerol-3-phosphate cytidylyltransferase [Pusillimonas sp.]|tara:strand:- start:417 stop:839 length:423 start_codon:yes stop_codon:yes gene_type:complete